VISLVSAVLIASLLGSFHCAGMCGAFLAMAVAGDDRATSKARLNAAYNGGRLVTYTILGALSGLLGAAANAGGELLGVQRAAMSAAGAFLVVYGIFLLLRLAGVRLASAQPPAAVRAVLMRAHRAAFALPPSARALAIGMLTTLLPCGWLYAFAITAAGTGDASHGALVMAVFWVGTLPVMAALGLGIQKLSGPLRRRLPVLTALTLVCVGVWALMGRMTLPAFASAPRQQMTIEEVAREASALDAHSAPCCNPESQEQAK
jgi:sulfite exporter TauE/SafE